MQQDKNDFEQICQNLNDKVSNMNHQVEDYQRRIKDMEDELDQKDQSFNEQETEIGRMDDLVQTLERNLKKTELKLRQVQVTKVKDLTNRIKGYQKENQELKALVDTLQNQQVYDKQSHSLDRRSANRRSNSRNSGIGSKHATQRMYKINDQANIPSRMGTRLDYMDQQSIRSIKEVEERFENTNGLRNYGSVAQKSPYAPNNMSFIRNASDSQLPLISKARAHSSLHNYNNKREQAYNMSTVKKVNQNKQNFVESIDK